jgi:hypothetical protein
MSADVLVVNLKLVQGGMLAKAQKMAACRPPIFG